MSLSSREFLNRYPGMAQSTQSVLDARASDASGNIQSPQWLTKRLYRQALTLAFVLGVFVRLFPVLTADFPLNDGGLFFTMSEDLQRSGYVLPEYTTYNHSQLPFAYSPLAFYITAAVGDLTASELVTIVRILPAVLSSLTLGAFFLLARELLSSEQQVLIATFAFAFIPRSFEWLIMGGGLTRALGMLCFLLTVWRVVLLYRSDSKRYIPEVALWGGLVILSHPGMAWLTVFSCGVLFVFLGRNRRAFVHSLLVMGGVAFLVFAWVLAVVEKHSFSVFVSALHTSSFFPYWIATLFNAISLSGEPVVQILLIIGYLGLVECIVQKQYLIPTWLLFVMLLSPRSAPTDASFLLALLIAVGVDRILLPSLEVLRSKIDGGSANPASLARSSYAALTVLFVYAFSTASISWMPELHPGTALRPISEADQRAMYWIAQAENETILPESRFLVLTSADFWQTDAVLEWFPSLARHKSITTVQGHEWLPENQFAHLQTHYNLSRSCIPKGLSCLEEWARSNEFEFTHIYISKERRGADTPERAFESLEASLEARADYHLIFGNTDVSIYARI